MSPASLGTLGQGQHCSSRGCAGKVWALPEDGRTPLLLVPKLGLALERGTVCGTVSWHLCSPSEPCCERANAHLLCRERGWNTQLGNGGLNPPLSLPPRRGLWGAGGKTSFSQVSFQSCAYRRKKRNKVKGEGEAGPVGGQAGDTEPSSRGSQLSSGSHSSLTSSPDCSQALVTAHSSSHVALGVLGPPGGHSSWVGWGEMHELQEVGMGNFQPLKARQQLGCRAL